jgi:adenosylcobyric acid synthase
MDPELGEMVKGKNGPVWSCQECFWAHRHDVAADFFREMNGRKFDDVSKQELIEIKKKLESRHFKRAKRLMVMGATSGAGKSLMCTAFCRIFSNMGYAVVPFKAQNMSLNSVVTDEGEEIARAQELQARGARVKPNSHMNPILLKPKGDSVSQVIVEGRPYKDMDVKQYYGEFTDIEGMEIVRRNISLLERTSDFVIIEGAGSPAEINMSEHDIVNMRTAEIAEASCILVVNIEWGGAFAYMYGTLMLLPEAQRKMFGGIIVTNMHGSPDSLAEGFEEIEMLTGVPVLGVVPHIELDLPD